MTFERFQNTTWKILSTLGLLVLAGLVSGVQSTPFGDPAIKDISSTPHKQFQVIVIDAGSTGSRANLFTLSSVNGKLILDEMFIVKTSPGLSAFGKRPKNVRRTLKRLLTGIRSRVPKEQRSRIRLMLFATAGLRLLPDQETQAILTESRRFLLRSGFNVDNDSVKVITGLEEGLFAWLAANFLAERLPDAARTVAALELGGASAQLTFALTHREIENIEKTTLIDYAKHLRHVDFFGHDFTVYARSFLGLGIMAARKAILLHPDNNQSENRGENLNRIGEMPIELRAECINPIVDKTEWSYENKKYLISGPLKSLPNSTSLHEKEPVVRFSTCLKIIRKVVRAIVPKDLPKVTKQIYAFSSYIFAAKEAGLVDPDEGGVIPLKSFYKAAAKACRDPNMNKPFACMDLSFIYILLRKGFGIDAATDIFLYPKINGYEANWALGAAFDALGHAKKRNFILKH